MIRNVAVPDRKIQRDSCKRCSVEVRFITGAYGQTLEICACYGGAPHPVVPDPSLASPPATSAERAERKRKARGPSIVPRGNPNFGRRN